MNIAVLQSGGPTSVLNASLAGIIRESENRFDRVLGIGRGFDGLLNNRIVDLSGLSNENRNRLRQTPSAALGTSRVRPTDDQLPAIVRRLDELDVTALIGIGGNDTADSLARLEEYSRSAARPVQVVGLPKTIDNDLAVTDHSLGYPSAARVIAAFARDALMDTIATSTLYPVKLIEVMGRNAGWLAASASLWIRDDLPQPAIITPERPLESSEEFLQLVQGMVDGQGLAMLIVPETMRWKDGSHVAGESPEWVDAFGHPYFASAGQALIQELGEQLGVRAKLDRPGSLTRSSIDYAATVDLHEAFEGGRFAVEALHSGQSGYCVTIRRTREGQYRSEFELTPLAALANVESVLPDTMFVQGSRELSAAFRDYALPLTGPSTQDYFNLDWSVGP